MGESHYPLYLDFEFNQVVESKVNLVSCATYDENKNQKEKFWLHNSPREQSLLRNFLKQYNLIVGYACVAEARSFLSLDLNPLDFMWVDLFLEYRMLTNHNDDLQWGKQLVDGKVKFVKKPKPKWQRSEEDGATGFKATHSLAEATYKLTGKIRDTEHKTKMRDLIISDPQKFSADERKDILSYNLEDVVFLPTIWKRTKEEFRKLDSDTSDAEYFTEAINRGRYSAHTARMEARGYPINIESTRNFSQQIPFILSALQRDINDQFPEIIPFRWNKRTTTFQWNQNATRDWIKENSDEERWMKTDGGKKKIKQLSLSLEAWEKFFQFKHTYPRGNFGAQMVRFLKMKQSLYGFADTGGKRKNFWDSVGSDLRVRPYMNIFGAQSGRSQPAASGFMFLKPAWMRSLVQPAPGKFIVGIDYGQQEFFLSALESNDQNMIDAYLSGDPYLYGAKLAGAIPENGTKSSHKIERDLFKNTYLGILYGMTKVGLAVKLTGDTGRVYTEEEAQEQIDIFEESFPDYMEWKQQTIDEYTGEDGSGMTGAIRLPCGWRMWGDNDNIRSVCNVPIQGFGASVMRKAVDIAESHDVKIVFTLHDALYAEGDVKDFAAVVGWLHDSMVEAFTFYFKDTEHYAMSSAIKLDPFAWSPDFKKDSEIEIGMRERSRLKIPVSNLYIDERAGDEYEKFKKYFSAPDADLL